MEDMEEDLDIHRKKPLNSRATPALPGCLQWRRCMGAWWSCWWTWWKKTTPKCFFCFFCFFRFEVFYFWKWALDSSGLIFFFKKLGALGASSVVQFSLRSLVKVVFTVFKTVSLLSPSGLLGWQGLIPKISRQPTVPGPSKGCQMVPKGCQVAIP